MVHTGHTNGYFRKLLIQGQIININDKYLY